MHTGEYALTINLKPHVSTASQKHGEFRPRRETGGERRTDKQRKVQVPVRPREAYVGSTTPGKDYHVGAGGVQRGRLRITGPQWGLRRRRK